MSQPVIVVGDGWAALGAVGFLVASGVEVCWLVGSGARCLPPTVGLNDQKGAQVWQELAQKYEISVGEPQVGIFLKEFRNKAFREPPWAKVPTLDARVEVIHETLWTPEQRFVGPTEFRFPIPVYEIEDQIRKYLVEGHFPNLKRVEGVPLKKMIVQNHAVQGVQLGSGEVIESSQVIYADRWSLLAEVESIPRPIPFLRRREPMGVFQVNFTHQPAIQGRTMLTFAAPMQKDPGEKQDKRFWGYFSPDGLKSVWTTCLSAEEGENNHEIAKKLKKLKSGLDKTFSGSDMLAPGMEFVSTIVDEQFRFEEEALFADGQPVTEPLELKALSGMTFLTDGYGPAYALRQVGSALGVAENTGAQAESLNSLDSETHQGQGGVSESSPSGVEIIN